VVLILVAERLHVHDLAAQVGAVLVVRVEWFEHTEEMVVEVAQTDGGVERPLRPRMKAEPAGDAGDFDRDRQVARLVAIPGRRGIDGPQRHAGAGPGVQGERLRRGEIELEGRHLGHGRAGAFDAQVAVFEVEARAGGLEEHLRRRAGRNGAQREQRESGHAAHPRRAAEERPRGAGCSTDRRIDQGGRAGPSAHHGIRIGSAIFASEVISFTGGFLPRPPSAGTGTCPPTCYRHRLASNSHWQVALRPGQVIGRFHALAVPWAHGCR